MYNLPAKIFQRHPAASRGIPQAAGSFTFSSLAQYRHGNASKITLRDRENRAAVFSLRLLGISCLLIRLEMPKNRPL
jgi:hypothetical protein